MAAKNGPIIIRLKLQLQVTFLNSSERFHLLVQHLFFLLQFFNISHFKVGVVAVLSTHVVPLGVMLFTRLFIRNGEPMHYFQKVIYIYLCAFSIL